MVEQANWRERRQPITASISVLLRPNARSNGLVLVRQDNQWGLPSGGLEPGEFLGEGIRREIEEETGIDRGKISFARHELIPKYIICLPRASEVRTQLGLAFEATYHGPKLSWKGWEIQGKEVDFARPFRTPELLSLIKDHLDAEQEEFSPIRKPHFNFHLILSTIVEWRRSSRAGHPGYINEFLARIKDQVEYLEITEFAWLERRWIYEPPCMYLKRDDEAERRRFGLRWGP